MLKDRYIDFQKQALADAPLNPYELSAAGLSELRKNIIISTAALAFFCGLLALLAPFGAPYDWGYAVGKQIGAGIAKGEILRVVAFGGLGVATLIAIIGSVFILTKATNKLMKTGLWWRVSVSDGLQDEWELRQKHKACTFAFEAIIWSFLGLFVGGMIVCGAHYLIAGDLPNPPRFGIVVAVSTILIWAMSLLPLIYLAWTLEPIDDDGLGAPITKPAETPKPVLVGKALWKKRAWDWGPIIVGLVIGVTWALNN